MGLTSDIISIMNTQPSGSYLIEYDKSSIPTIVTQNGLRILIGQSKKGVVNKAMYIDSLSTFTTYFGSIDRSMERKGSYFHRFAAQMILSGPFIALNIRQFDDELDLSGLVELSITANQVNNSVKLMPYTSAFNTQRFWYIDPEEMIDYTVDDQPLVFQNVGSTKKSFFFRKSTQSGYSSTLNDWYDSLGRELPAYLDGNNYVSDFMVDMYVFDVDFSDLENVKSNDVYGYLFTSDGVLKDATNALGDSVDGLTQLRNISSAGFVKKYTGSLIPQFTDISGASLSLDTLVNQDVDKVGLIAAFNLDVFDEASLWSATLDENDNIIYESNGAKKTKAIDTIGESFIDMDASADANIDTYAEGVTNMMSYSFNNSLESIDERNPNATMSDGTSMIEYTSVIFPQKLKMVDGEYVYTPDVLNECYRIGNVTTSVGDKVIAKSGNYANVINAEYIDTIYKFQNGIHTRDLPLQANGEAFPQDDDGVFVYPTAHPNDGAPVEYESTDVDAAPLDGIDGDVIAMPTLTDSEYYTLSVTYGNSSNLTKLTFDREIYIKGSTTVTSVTPIVREKFALSTEDTFLSDYFMNDLKIYQFIDYDDIVTTYKPITLKAYTIRNDQFVNGTVGRQDDITSIVIGDLRKALKDKEYIQFDYIVDSFKTYMSGSIKSSFMAIASERQMCTYLGSAPSINEMVKSTDPYFRATASGKFDSSYIKTGGNTQLPYTKLVSLPTIGSSYGGFFANNIIIDDNGAEVSLPTSGIVSNTFVEKRKKGQVYNIASSSRYGGIIGLGIKRLEYDPDDSDRKYFEDFGYNLIVNKANTGMQIKGNSTASVKVKSAFSLLHVRELLNAIETTVRSITERYEDDFNTAQNRLLMKTSIYNVLNSYSPALEYFDVVVNSDNNDAEIRDNELGIIDTIIVPNKGMKQIIHRMTVNSATGLITSETN